MGPLWRIDMLGALRAISEDATITRFRTRRVGLLLAFLAYHRDRAFSRDEIADMLWPDFGVEQAKINLRQALASLRRHIEPPPVPKGAILIAEQDRISLNPALIQTDVAEFGETLDEARNSSSQRFERLRSAIELYKGDLLPGFYEEWVLTARHRLEDLYVAALDELIRECDGQGRLEEAIPQIHAALVKDRFREDLHFALIRAYLASGSQTRALRHYEDWRSLAHKELGIEPSRELQELIRDVSPCAPRVRRETGPTEAEVPRQGSESRQSTVKLPLQLTRFFGRSEESKRVVNMFAADGSRLVTIFGPAGAGKTRLSIEVGKILGEEQAWNVWFVPLADISHGSMLMDSMLKAMKVQRRGQMSPVAAIQASVMGSRNLIILDNLEHIVDSAIPAIASILAEATGVSCLATSRQCLNLQGEQRVDLSSLSQPGSEFLEVNPSKTCPRNRLVVLASMPTIQLFVDRAQSVCPDFQLTARNAYAVAAICSKLDGLPLAIEIAAGLSNAFTPAQLLANLGDRLEILRSRLRDVSPRHRSLWAAISYSYDLLSPDLQRFFAELSVFRGGFDLAAAEKICLSVPSSEGSRPRKKARDCLRAVLDLQERSLIRTEEGSDRSGARFRLLESFREFGREQLSSQEEDSVQLRHADYCYQLAAEYFIPRKKPVLHSDLENWLAAVETYRNKGDLHRCVGLLVGMRTGSHLEHEMVKELANLPEIEALSKPDRIWLYSLLCRYHCDELNFEKGRRAGSHAVEIASEFGDDNLLCVCHAFLSDALSFLGLTEDALIHAQLTVLHGEKAGNPHMVEIGLTNVGVMHASLGNSQLAMTAFKAAYRVPDSPTWTSAYNLAEMSMDLELLDDGLQFAGEGLRLAQTDWNSHGTAVCLGMIARYHLLKGNLSEALALSHEVLTRRRSGTVYWLLDGLQRHAAILVAETRYREGAILLAAASVVGMRRNKNGREQEDALELAQANLAEPDFEKAWVEGLAMGLDQAVSYALEFQ